MYDTRAETSQMNNFPDHLKDYAALVEHINTLLEGKPPSEKGDRFARFIVRCLPQTKVGMEFGTPELRPVKTHDKGVDLVANGKDGRSILYIQAKKRVDSAQDIRDVMDGFNEYLTFLPAQSSVPQPELTGLSASEYKVPHCLLFTLSRLPGILRSYEERPSTTKELYDTLRKEDRLHFVDGDDILAVLQAAYRKFSGSPYDLVLNFESEVCSKDNVFVGIISSDEIRRLYLEFGDALFFENVRDFLGINTEKQKGRSTPNQDIVRTITSSPDRMLERNNGIVVRADEVLFGDSKRQLILSRGGVVNGCQTTMCIVDSANQTCYVPVKVVQTSAEDAWDITKAANYQTQVPDIDLEIARSLRPQLLRRYGFITGVEVDHGKKSALQMLDDMYDRRITYTETRLLYIGIFSRTPNNLIAGNYTELEPDLVRMFYRDDPYGENVFRVLLALQMVAAEGRERVRRTFNDAPVFERFYEPDTPIYQCFVSLLALCGSIEMDITDRVLVGVKGARRGESRLAIAPEYERMKEYLEKADALLEGDKQRFLEHYVAAFNVWKREMGALSDDDDAIRQIMYSRTKSMSFTRAYTTLRDDMRTFKQMAPARAE